MKYLFALLLIFTFSHALEPMLPESNFAYVKQCIGKGKPFFLEIGSDSCYACQEMGKKLYRYKKQHKDFELHFINVEKNRALAHQLEVRMIPTQIVYDANGKEVYRHIGLLSDKNLIDLFQKYGF